MNTVEIYLGLPDYIYCKCEKSVHQYLYHKIEYVQNRHSYILIIPKVPLVREKMYCFTINYLKLPVSCEIAAG